LLLRLLGPTLRLGLSDLAPRLGFGSTPSLCLLSCFAFGLGFGLSGLPSCLRFGRSSSLGLLGSLVTSFFLCGPERLGFGGALLLLLGGLASLFLARRPTFGRFPGFLLFQTRAGRIGFRLPAGRALGPLSANPVELLRGLSRWLRGPAAKGLREVERRAAGRFRDSTDATERIACGSTRRSGHRSRDRSRQGTGLLARWYGGRLRHQGNDGVRR